MLRSIDVQQILLNSTAVEKLQQVQQQHPEVEKKHFALQLQQEVEQRKKEVQDTTQTEELIIREEERRKKSDAECQRGGKGAKGETVTSHREEVAEINQGKILDLIV